MRGTPMALYFIEDQDEQSCGLYLNDGNCDLSFNTINYYYDEGDCCAATCTDSSYGLGGITSVFGNTNISGDCFPSCIDPSMVPITIRIDNIYETIMIYLQQIGLNFTRTKTFLTTSPLLKLKI